MHTHYFGKHADNTLLAADKNSKQMWIKQKQRVITMLRCRSILSVTVMFVNIANLPVASSDHCCQRPHTVRGLDEYRLAMHCQCQLHGPCPLRLSLHDNTQKTEPTTHQPPPTSTLLMSKSHTSWTRSSRMLSHVCCNWTDYTTVLYPSNGTRTEHHTLPLNDHPIPVSYTHLTLPTNREV